MCFATCAFKVRIMLMLGFSEDEYTASATIGWLMRNLVLLISEHR